MKYIFWCDMSHSRAAALVTSVSVKSCKMPAFKAVKMTDGLLKEWWGGACKVGGGGVSFYVHCISPREQSPGLKQI